MPLAGVIILLLLLWLNGIFYGFSAAVHNLSGSELRSGRRKEIRNPLICYP